MKEATARIKINKLLEAAGWRFFPDSGRPANIKLEHTTTLTPDHLDCLGEDFEKTSKGFIDFLLLNEKGFPFIVLEAKSEDKNPLVGKEQARKYARSQNCRFVILSNGNLHYFWDLERGNPNILTAFPSPESVGSYQKVEPNPSRLVEEPVGPDYIVLTQRPNYKSEAAWINEAERPGFVEANRLRFLREYQLKAVQAVQKAVREGKDRFLFEMATGTGKTLTAAAVIKLFLRSQNASRVLFLVDRLELEDQAKKAFAALLANDLKAVIFKENRDDWHHAEIVVSTVQSLLFNNKYQKLFSPTDFDLVISDEAHRSIGGNARAVFDYFVGYKLGLTATPRDYLKRFDREASTGKDPREYERRLLLDTYRTFGCEQSEPTFRYTLLDGVKDGFLINPTVVDARTGITTQLLSEEGFTVDPALNPAAEEEASYGETDFERKFFAEATNMLFCKTFLENALRDPISGEIGKSIVFAVSQNHAAKIAQILNQMADIMFPGRYHSDFAVQVTSGVTVPDPQQMAINFANNNLLGSGNFIPAYKTSKARVCVTVGMMTTGYDCPDILNLALMRPIFSPTDFIQMKGRGTRGHNFTDEVRDDTLRSQYGPQQKTAYKLFDFFATCEYFEEKFDYDQVIPLPVPGGPGEPKPGPQPVPGPISGPVPPPPGAYVHTGADILATLEVQTIGPEGMRIDREFFVRFEDVVRQNPVVVAKVDAGEWQQAVDYVAHEVLDKPDEFFTLEKLRRAAAADRRLSLREILEKTFGLITRFKTKDELLDEEFAKFVADRKPPEDEAIPALRNYFKAYVSNGQIRQIIDSRHYTDLATSPAFSTLDFRAVPEPYRALIPEYVKDYVSLNQFAP
jgi:type I restriction enzyme R subunit